MSSLPFLWREDELYAVIMTIAEGLRQPHGALSALLDCCAAPQTGSGKPAGIPKPLFLYSICSV